MRTGPTGTITVSRDNGVVGIGSRIAREIRRAWEGGGPDLEGHCVTRYSPSPR